MQIEEHRTGFDQTLTLEQSTAEQIGEEACLFFFPHSRRPPRRTRVLCSAAKEKPRPSQSLRGRAPPRASPVRGKEPTRSPSTATRPHSGGRARQREGPRRHQHRVLRPRAAAFRCARKRNTRKKKETRQSLARRRHACARATARAAGGGCDTSFPGELCSDHRLHWREKEKGGERERRERRLGGSRPWRGRRTGRRGGKMPPVAAPDPSWVTRSGKMVRVLGVSTGACRF